MWEKRLLLSIVLLGLIGGSESEIVQSKENKCYYIVGVSPVLKSGEPETVSLTIKSEESVQVVVTLEYQSTKVFVFNDTISPDTGFHDCREIQVPAVNKTQLVYMTISVTGETVKIKERMTVAIDIMPKACTFQTEKNMYAPGDTVRFRYFCFDHNMMPIQPNVNTIYFVEPNGARVAQIPTPVVDSYIISGEFLLSGVATTGSYRIDCMKDDGETDTTYVTVELYTLPRFNSQVTCSSALSVTDETAEINVSAKYVYGKPLDGIVIATCTRIVAYASLRTRNCMKGLEDISVEYTGELVSGAWIKNMNLDPFEMQMSEYDSSIQCTVTVKEIGTGVLDTKYCYMSITKQPANLQIESYYDQYYRRGIDFPLAVSLANEKGEAIANKVLTIEVDGVQIMTVTTDDNGRAECGIDTTPYYKENITIRACYPDEDQCYATDQSSPWMFNRFGQISPYPNNPGYPCIDRLIYRMFSETDSYFQIKKKTVELTCFGSYSIQVDFKVTEAGVGEGKLSMTVYHMVTSKQNIVLCGQTNVDLAWGWKGSYNITLNVTAEYGPQAQLLVYTVMGPEIISDNCQLSISPCSLNQVSLNFTESVVAPGSNVTRVVSAAPGSICGLRARDSSLDLLGYFDAFTYNSLLNLVQYYQYGYQVNDFNLEAPPPPCEDPNSIMFCHGRYVQRTSSPTDGDTYNNLRASNVMFFTNRLTMRPQVCGMEQIDNPPGPIFFKAAAGLANVDLAGSGGGPTPITTVRTNVDDIFGYDTVLTGPEGKVNSISIIPDTITTWKSDAFCISKDAGVGVSIETAQVTTFLPFFVEGTMPKYCIRGETVEVVITVANYMDNCAQVDLRIVSSDEYDLESMSDDSTICVCNGERASKKYNVTFKSLDIVNITIKAATTSISKLCNGTNDDSEPPRSDTVISKINVAGEGIKKEDVYSFLNIVTDSSTEKEVTISMPENMVPDTSAINLSVPGDTVGLIAANFQNLLTQPAGCCEQMLSQILPLYFMRQYLEFAGIIDDELNEQAKSLFCSGYGSMLACRTWDGRFTLFPNSDGVNSWVLVKTLFAFAKMKEENCYVDDSVLQQALEQLGKLQDVTTGCLTPEGQFLTTPDDKDIPTFFTAYAATHLAQMDNLFGIGGPILEGALTCLQNANQESLGTYILAYICHAAARSGRNDIWNTASTILKSRAINTGGATYWTNDNFPLTNQQYVPSSPVDMTANILMGFMWGPVKDINYIGPIAAWMASCMNSKGGFSSSEDTMSATQVMTEYARMVFVNTTNCQVVARQNDTELANISVNEANKMLVQKKSLNVTSGTITITITGTCATLVQVVHDYNTKVKTDNSSFSLSVFTQTGNCIEGVAYVLNTNVCVSYTGKEQKTNMVYMQINQMTGWQTDRASLDQLIPVKKVSYVQLIGNTVFLYWPFMEAFVQTCFNFTSFMENRVPYYKSTTIIVSDYYNWGETASALYSYSC